MLRGVVPTDIAAAAVAALEDDGCAPDTRRAAVEACTVDTMLDAIDELFGEGYTLTRRRGGSDLARVQQPGTPWPEPRAHVDDSYPTIMPGGWAVGSFTFLTRVQAHGGAFVCFPGSYRRYRALMARSCECIKGAAQVPENSGPHMEFLAEPGDVVLFHHLCGHTGSDNIVDPVTRHALLNRWHPEQRIVPGDKPFATMTTIEKVNSARYQAHCEQAPSERNVVDPDPLVAGITLAKSVRSFAILHFGGCLHLFHVGHDDPHLLQRAVSDDGVDWNLLEPIDLQVGDVRTLQFHQYGIDAILGISTTAGSTRVFSSIDMENWRPRSMLDGVHTATPWFVYAQYPSKVAGGQAVFVVPQDRTDQVVCSWGDDWDGADSWTTRSVALRAQASHCIEDVTIAAHFADSSCTFVVDLRNNDSDTQPYYAQPQDVAIADTELRPLPYDCDTAPRNLRILHRARRYWLVVYLRPTAAGDRMFWGRIDWSAAEPALHELLTPAQLHEAWSVVGFA